VNDNESRLHLAVTGEKAAERELVAFGDAAEDAGDKVAAAGASAAASGKAAEGAGDEWRESGQDLGYLRRQAEQATVAVQALTLQLDRTGDTSLKTEIRKAKRSRNEALAFLKEIAPAPGDIAEAAVPLGAGILDGVVKGLGSLGPVKIAVAGAGVAVAPLIGASIGAAVLGGVGVGGIIGGIALASQDSRVAAAGKDLGATFAAEFGSQGAAEPFVAPLLDSIAILKAASKDTAADARAAFATIAPVLRPLTLGLAEASDRFLPRLTRGLEGAKPVVRALGEIIPDIAEAAGDLVETIGEDSDGAVLALGALRDITVELVGGFGNIVYGLQQIYEWTTRTTEASTSWAKGLVGGGEAGQIVVGGLNDYLRDHLGLLERSKDESNDFAGSVEAIGESAEDTETKIKTLKNAIDELFGKTMSLDQATLSYKRGLADLADELTDGRRSLDENTEAGQDNIAAVLEQIQRVEDLRKAQAESSIGIDRANRLYETHIEQLRKTLLSLGYNKAKVDELIDRYKAIPRSVETTVGIILKTQGSESAWAALRRAEREEESRSINARASGGPARKGEAYWVGEHGPELVTMGADGYVHNTGASRAMTAGAGVAVSAPVNVNVMLAPGGGLDEVGAFLWGWFQRNIAVTSGGSAEGSLGRPEGGGPL
jgi:hypothetical protein